MTNPQIQPNKTEVRKLHNILPIQMNQRAKYIIQQKKTGHSQKPLLKADTYHVGNKKDGYLSPLYGTFEEPQPQW